MKRQQSIKKSFRCEQHLSVWIDKVATELGVDGSDVIRECLSTIYLSGPKSDAQRNFKRLLRDLCSDTYLAIPEILDDDERKL